MKTLFMNIALLLSVTAQAQTRDSIDVCQFVVVYDHLIHTFTFAGLLNRQAPITYPEAPEDKMTVLATDMVVPKTAHVYQPLELE